MSKYSGWVLIESKWKECESFESKNRKEALMLLMSTYDKRVGTVKIRRFE